MSAYSPDGWYVREIGCKVNAMRGIWDYSVAKIENPLEKKYYFKTSDDYFKHIIAKLKEDILRNVPDLRCVSIQLHAFDHSNIMHRLILTVANIVHDALHIREHIRLWKMACIVVTYDHIPIFIGSACF